MLHVSKVEEKYLVYGRTKKKSPDFDALMRVKLIIAIVSPMVV